MPGATGSQRSAGDKRRPEHRRRGPGEIVRVVERGRPALGTGERTAPVGHRPGARPRVRITLLHSLKRPDQRVNVRLGVVQGGGKARSSDRQHWLDDAGSNDARVHPLTRAFGRGTYPSRAPAPLECGARPSRGYRQGLIERTPERRERILNHRLRMCASACPIVLAERSGERPELGHRLEAVELFRHLLRHLPRGCWRRDQTPASPPRTAVSPTVRARAASGRPWAAPARRRATRIQRERQSTERLVSSGTSFVGRRAASAATEPRPPPLARIAEHDVKKPF